MSARRRADLQGDLAVLAPEIVLQVLALVRADGVLELSRPPERGQVFFRGGRVVHVVVGSAARRSRRGAAAAALPRTDPHAAAERLRDEMAKLLGWRDGTFAFQSGAGSEVQGVPFDVEGLLLECVTRMDRVRGGATGEQRG